MATSGTKKGGQKTGGRKKGTPNKKTSEFLEQLGNFDSVGELKDIFYKTDDPILKFNIIKTILEYQFPKRKAVEMAADMNINTESIQIELI